MTPTQDNNVPYFFLINEGYAVGTPKAMAESDRTFDIPFKDLAVNYDLQYQLGFLSVAFIKPAWKSLTVPGTEEELLRGTAFYLSFFTTDPQEREKKRKYLVDDGPVRILIKNDKLKEEISDLFQA
jgi:hypothetical protein